MVNITRASDLTMVGANGGGWTAPLGTAAPDSPLSQPVSPWTALGAISDDGLTYGFDEDSQEFQPWGLTSPFRTQITKSVRTFGLTVWETSRLAVQSLQYRLDEADLEPDVDGLTKFAETASPAPDRRAFWFVVLDGDSARGFYVPQGEINDRSDVSFKQDEMSGYEWTITTYPDAAGNTVYHVDKVPTTPAEVVS
ncbi:phage tail protein [Streptomyces nigrescens]|uniref:Tail protein n=1 Tax=Streptomyces nigrescens TaxID=1920 RepID=A0A640TEE3_STRNI|nr:phage tail protein [Streptomyces libani]WAT94869.1 phage tail protein [Streptomyces libani subsp. libani]GFE20015.1 tail protein [Streptomyces libani subsp. libani]GGV85570.1 tail protein [Streptomyces libani subsp. libani]